MEAENDEAKCIFVVVLPQTRSEGQT
jgi:hypothetical protein